MSRHGTGRSGITRALRVFKSDTTALVIGIWSDERFETWFVIEEIIEGRAV